MLVLNNDTVLPSKGTLFKRILVASKRKARLTSEQANQLIKGVTLKHSHTLGKLSLNTTDEMIDALVKHLTRGSLNGGALYERKMVGAVTDQLNYLPPELNEIPNVVYRGIACHWKNRAILRPNKWKAGLQILRPLLLMRTRQKPQKI